MNVVVCGIDLVIGLVLVIVLVVVGDAFGVGIVFVLVVARAPVLARFCYFKVLL